MPGEHSIINVKDYSSPKVLFFGGKIIDFQELGEYLTFLNENEEEYQKYFEWKKFGFSKNFLDKFNKCVFYNSDCRLCHKLAGMRNFHEISHYRPSQTIPKTNRRNPQFSRHFCFRNSSS